MLLTRAGALLTRVGAMPFSTRPTSQPAPAACPCDGGSSAVPPYAEASAPPAGGEHRPAPTVCHEVVESREAGAAPEPNGGEEGCAFVCAF